MILGMALIVASQATQSAQCVAEVRNFQCHISAIFFCLYTHTCCHFSVAHLTLLV
jgi:hypothetical protein